MGLDISTHTTTAVARVSPAGEIDLANRDELLAAIAVALTDDVTNLVVDLAAVTFIDSSGISALVAGRVMALEQGAIYQVVNPAGIVARIFDITGVTSYLRGEDR